MEWVESTGKTIDEAKDVALDRLGVHEDDAEFEVVADVKTGLFGRVKEEARVRARVRPTTPRAKDDRRRGRGGRRGGGRGSDGGDGRGGQKGQKKGGDNRGNGAGGERRGSKDSGNRNPSRGGGRSEKSGRSEKAGQSDKAGRSEKAGQSEKAEQKEKVVSDEQATMPLTEQADIAQEFVGGLAERFGATVSFERAEIDDDIHLTVSGNDLGRMIGRRGATAMAIDELVRTVLQRQAGSSRDGRIRVDIGGIRARRTEALTRFCKELAAEVREQGVARALEPMGAADRKVVHDVITDEAGVDTVSEGEDPNRRVVIVPLEDAD